MAKGGADCDWGAKADSNMSAVARIALLQEGMMADANAGDLARRVAEEQVTAARALIGAAFKAE